MFRRRGNDGDDRSGCPRPHLVSAGVQIMDAAGQRRLFQQLRGNGGVGAIPARRGRRFGLGGGPLAMILPVARHGCGTRRPHMPRTILSKRICSHRQSPRVFRCASGLGKSKCCPVLLPHQRVLQYRRRWGRLLLSRVSQRWWSCLRRAPGPPPGAEGCSRRPSRPQRWASDQRGPRRPCRRLVRRFSRMEELTSKECRWGELGHPASLRCSRLSDLRA